ncbi:2774_t:CDS:2, partial [Funneliformis geosporum]
MLRYLIDALYLAGIRLSAEKLSAIQSRLLKDSLDCDNQRVSSMYARAGTCAD